MKRFLEELFRKLRYTPRILRDAFSDRHRVRNILWMLVEILIGVGAYELSRDLGFFWAYALACLSMFLSFEYFASLPSIGLTSWYWERGPKYGEGDLTYPECWKSRLPEKEDQSNG
jgi:hypothetical protein